MPVQFEQVTLEWQSSFFRLSREVHDVMQIVAWCLEGLLQAQKQPRSQVGKGLRSQRAAMA